MIDRERLAMEIYWAPYDQHLGRNYSHVSGDLQRPTITLDMAKAWSMANDVQRAVARRQAERAIAYIESVQRG